MNAKLLVVAVECRVEAVGETKSAHPKNTLVNTYRVCVFGRQHAWGRLLSQVEMVGLIMSKILPPLNHLKTPIKDLCGMCRHYDPKKPY